MIKQYQLNLSLKGDFTVELLADLFNQENDLINSIASTAGCFFVIDKGIGEIATDKVISYLKHYNLINENSDNLLLLAGGEQLKDGLTPALNLISGLEDAKIDRKGKLFLIGGGSLLDMGGFAASMYHRGIDYVRIPTTLLSQIDAGIGTKNGINYLRQKNSLGFFKSPQFVFIDPEFLVTLPDRQIRSGLAEAIKIALISHKELFRAIEKNYQDLLKRDFLSENSLYIIWETIVAHLDQIMSDPHENKIARPLDYGHEWGHRLEIISDHELNHGEAISVGMALDSHISYQKGFLTTNEVHKIIGLFITVGLPVYHHLATKDNLWQGLDDFRRHLGGELTITLLNQIGVKIDTHEISEDELESAIEFLKSY